MLAASNGRIEIMIELLRGCVVGAAADAADLLSVRRIP
jgi:hypothetical protein